MLLPPTHTAFDDVLDFYTGVPVEMRHEFFVMHGICTRPTQPRRFAHAWIEHESGFVLMSGVVDGVLAFGLMTRDAFEAEFQVEHSTRYSFAEALAENARADHFGPWVPAYRELCFARDEKGASHGL